MNDKHISEAAARRVLARAIEVDEQRGLAYSIAELREVAAEAGVSAAAFERALREIEAPPAASTSLTSRLAAVTGVGLVLGATTGLVDTATHFISSPIAMCVTLIVVAGLGVVENFRSPLRGLIRFSINSVALWGGYTLAWALSTTASGGVGPLSTSLMWGTTLMGAVLTAVTGAALTAYHVIRQRKAPQDEAPIHLSLRQRIAVKLKRWIDIWANRIEIDLRVATPYDRACSACGRPSVL